MHYSVATVCVCVCVCGELGAEVYGKQSLSLERLIGMKQQEEATVQNNGPDRN